MSIGSKVCQNGFWRKIKVLEYKLITNTIYSHNFQKPSFGSRLTVLQTQAERSNFDYNISPEAAKEKANILMKSGRFTEAESFYKFALKHNSKDPELNLNFAKNYTFNNKYKEAIPYLQEYLKQNPKDIENVTLLGECYKKTGMYAKATEHFNKALSIEPNYDYAKRNLLDTQNLHLACINPEKAQKERYETAIENLTQAVKIARNFLPKGFMDDMKDLTVSFDKTSKMGGRSNIAQYEHYKRKISVTDEYTYANPKLTGAYLIHEFIHGKDNDPYTSIREEQDAYRLQAQYWTQQVHDVYDPEMDYVAELYKTSAETLDKRVAEIYKLRDPDIANTSYNHPPSKGKAASYKLSVTSTKPLKAYDIIV